MKIISGAATDTGQVREENEDSYLVDRRLELFAIADGMGGHRAGEVASATALAALQNAMNDGVLVGDAVGRANSAVWDQASSNPDLAGMGTTVTAAWSNGTTLTVAHVGDSRAYLLRGDGLQQVTVDHTLVEELIRDGRLTPEQAAVHPQRSIITRALGVDSRVDVDVYSLVLQPNDRVMLCSDGLTSMVRTGHIAELLRRESDPTAAANALVDAANAAGGEDNITVVVLDCTPDGVDPLPSSVAAAITARSARGRDAAASGSSGSAGAGPAELVEPAAITVVTQSSSLDSESSSGSAASPAAGATARTEGKRGRGRPPRDTARYRTPRARRRVGRGVWRVLAFALPIVIVIGVGIGTIAWYAKNSYFVAFENQRVVIFQGRPGGLLFWDPEVIERTGLAKSRMTDFFKHGVQARKEFSSKAAAFAFVARARDQLSPGPSTTSTTSTTRATSSTTVGLAPPPVSTP